MAAVAPEPELLLLDEPMAGLDPLACDEVVETVIAAAPERSWTVLFSSHSLDDVQRLADFIAVVVAGRLVRRFLTFLVAAVFFAAGSAVCVRRLE